MAGLSRSAASWNPLLTVTSSWETWQAIRNVGFSGNAPDSAVKICCASCLACNAGCGETRARLDFEIVNAGSGKKKGKLKAQQLVAIPVLKIAASHGEKNDGGPLLHEALVESMIAAPRDWCPNPMTTSCLRVRGNSMAPLIYDGYILAVDSMQNDPSTLDGKIVIAWHKDSGLTVSRFRWL